jgi:uncharacterized membrane protein
MPEMITLGWFHTIIAILAIVSGAFSLKNHRVIAWSQTTGKVFLICTLLTTSSALMIYQRGTFGLGHAFAVLTLGAILVGMIAEKTSSFGKISTYIQAMAYSGIFLFHMIPAITDGLMRLPVNNPIVSEITDPLLKGFYGFFLLCYFVGLAIQWRWIRDQKE